MCDLYKEKDPRAHNRAFKNKLWNFLNTGFPAEPFKPFKPFKTFFFRANLFFQQKTF